MIDLAQLEDAPLFEPIQTMQDHRRERRVKTARRLRKSWCAKQPYSKKQALSQRNFILAKGKVPYLTVYKCAKCDCWHLTHKRPWNTA